MASETWWVIKHPDLYCSVPLLPWSARETRVEAQAAIVRRFDDGEWKVLYRRGYRAVKITVTETEAADEA